ncbi:MAG: hypothetical protein IPK64_06340 [bacterium]|nr:hypothetical protein [bacterium]
MTGSRPRYRRLGALSATALLWAAFLAAVPAPRVSAQTDDGTDDSAEEQPRPPDAGLRAARDMADAARAQGDSLAAASWDSVAAAEQAAIPEVPGKFLQDLTFSPVGGVRANVRQYTLYSDWTTTARFGGSASGTQVLNWSLEEYRKQEKTVENRKGSLDYNFGKQLPMVTIINSNWNWSEDRTTNTAGFSNLYKVDNKTVNLNSSQHKVNALGLTNSVRVGGNFTDQASLNQEQRNDFREGTAGANLQSGWEARPGVAIVGRAAATATGGTRLLAGRSSPSSATGDSLGVGIYVKRGIGTAFVEMTRSNFEKKYLEFRRNANGLIDTVGVPEDQKVVSELETRDALAFKLDYKLAYGGLKSEFTGTHLTDDLQLATGLSGLKQREAKEANLKVGYKAGRDSVSVAWKYGLKWDDQRIQSATVSRGRQYVQERDLLMKWQRRLFSSTRMELQYHEGLTQDIAQDGFNANDKDRLTRDFSSRLDRAWRDRFRTSMVFSWRQTQDLSIRGSSSSNNNFKDSYELAPGFNWKLAPWIDLDQSYRLYIQYTDYVYSYLAAVTRKDDYNKRGDLVTKITCRPSSRLTVTIRHDWNRRFNATKSTEDAAGRAFYQRDLEQDISKIDLDVTYAAGPGITLEAGTYRTRDEKTSPGRANSTSRTDSGELVVGGRVDRKFGRMQRVQVSAMVKKINAFGPSITASSSDFWEADAWLKWTF